MPDALPIAEILDRLEALHGKQSVHWPADPYEFLVWWHAGYPASDDRCAKGWEALRTQVGIAPEKILQASREKLAAALRPGGMVPEQRAMRLKDVAARVTDECAGDLRAKLTESTKPRALLKKFPGISDPGADRILLFAGISPLAAVPSNATQVLARILRGQERDNYSVTYKETQESLEAALPEEFEARQRAFLLLKRHGQEICKRSNPLCGECPLSRECKYRGREQPPR